MNYATTKDVADGFKAAGERMDDFEGDLEQAKEYIKQLSNTIKSLRGMSHFGSDYKDAPGILFFEEHAKMIGECVLAALGKKDMGELTAAGGGVLVPDEATSRIIDLMAKYGKFRKNTSVLKIGGGITNVPKIETDMTVYCPGEGGEVTDSDVSFSQVKLQPKTWAALAKVSNELDEDSLVAIGYIVGLSIARSMAKKEDLVGFLGDGTSTYFGHTGIVGKFMSISDTISEIAGLKVASGNAWSEITLQDFRDVISLLPEDFDESAKWYMSKKFYNGVCWALAQAAGVANIFEILSDKKARHFLGYEVEFVSAMPKTEANSQIPCILGDLGAGSYLGERKVLTIEQSRDVFFKNYQTGIIGVERIDVNTFGCGDTTNPGPIVGLITAAS
ncbi:MAG: phage major capsid protein [Phycisphaerae bacterium]|nr:phage major capsid protein [Phycisphaerae bacterium]